MPLTAESEWDVIVIGAGAAGLIAADYSAQRGRRTLLLEKNTKPGVKILMSGGTRCNLTHDTDVSGMVTAFGPQGRFLRTALYDFPPSSVVHYFRQAGVPTKVEATGKVFPVSDRALDVQRALCQRVQSAGAVMLTGHAVLDLQRRLDGWAIWTAERQFTAARVIVTTGGCSYPGCGTRGDGYDWMRRLGHSVVTPRPALVPLTTDERWIHELSGVTLDDVQVWVVPAESLGGKQDAAELLASCRRRMLAQRRGSLLFTHQGLSGPAAMDVSREVTRFDDPDAIRFVCDFLPHQSLDALQAHLEQEARRQGARTAGRFLAGYLPQRLANQLLGRAGVDPQRPLAEVSRTARRDLLRQVKSTVVRLTGTRGFAKAEVTAGGIALTDVDPRTMASKRVPDLYLAGELLDVDGPIGGYNFQAAFSTGRLAASTAAR